MYERLDSCPSCGHTHFVNYLICNDHAFTKESFALVKCDKCQLVFTNPRPDSQKIVEYYKSNTYISHTNKSNSLINLIYKIVRSFTLRSKLRVIQRYKKGKTILDYGSGTGQFINFMANNNWDAYGYEPNVLQTSPTQTTVKYFKNITEIKESEKFDVITAWHVIEHVHELIKTIKLFRKQLKKGGYIFIAVPNIKSFDALHYKAYWAAYDVPRHLYHFSKDSMKYLVNKLNLRIVKVLPMKFDAFYVSLLSEKYAMSNSLTKAIKVGLKSNTLAKKSGQYSSLIYVIKG